MLKFHAHLFFEQGDAERARAVGSRLARATSARVSGWLDRPGGPLPMPQVQVELTSIELGAVVEWLMLSRAGFSVLIHPETDDDLLDHTDRALWLGRPLDLRLDRL